MTRDQYVTLLHGLLSGESERVREANRSLFSQVVQDADPSDRMDADLALVDATGSGLRGGA